jgi:hypothetical protein
VAKRDLGGGLGVLIGQGVGGVIFGLAAAWLALMAIRSPVTAPLRAGQGEKLRLRSR